MSPSWRNVFVAALAGAGCHSGESVLAERSVPAEEVVVPQRPPPPKPEQDPEREVEAVAVDEVVVPLRFGVEITLPREAAGRAGSSPDHYGVELKWKTHVSVSRIELPMPDAIRLPQSMESAATELAKGVTDTGIRWSVYTYEASVGHSSDLGHVHYLERVSRLVAILALDERTHAQCAGYLKYGIESVDDEAMRGLARICLSMVRTHKP